MLPYLVVGLSLLTAYFSWKKQSKLPPRELLLRPNPPRTLVDASNIEDVIRLVQLHDRDDERVFQRLKRTFVTFPPTHGVMERLSMLHQQYAKDAGLRGFCSATAYCAAIESLILEDDD